ncbi:hypothetical protein [Thermogutta sp.]|uniref:hypothetical protein n=1 Tax=Thermogutta sp. TaxID=1962930 RepID=UPI003C7A7205
MDTDVAENLAPESLDSSPEPLDPRERSRSDMWRAVALFAIFAGTVGLALVPPTRLPVLLSVFFSAEEHGQTSDAERKARSGKLSFKRDAFEIPSVASESDGRYRSAGNTFHESPAQVVQASPVPPIGSATPLETDFGVTGPGRAESPGRRNPPSNQDSRRVLGSGRNENPSAIRGVDSLATDVAGSRPPWQSATKGLVDGELPSDENPSMGSQSASDLAPPLASMSPQQHRPRQQQTSSLEGIEQLEQLAQQFRALGAARYRLERWGTDGQLFRFTCEMPVKGVPHMTRLLEAIAPSPEEAMRRVLTQISGNSSDAGPHSPRGF